MSIELQDGSILPAYLIDDSSSLDGWAASKNEYSLRVGTVVKAFSAVDSLNTNKKFIEYDVEVFHVNGTGGQSLLLYRNVQVASLFGGVADYFRWTPRIENPPLDGVSSVGLGSKVLMLCVNADNQFAYIVGGIPHFKNTIPETIDDGLHLRTEFNGVNFNVNKDGEFTVLHKGPTTADGLTNPIDTGGGSTVSLTKEGNINIGYVDLIPNPLTDQFKTISSIVWNKPDKKLQLFADSDIYSETNAKFIIQTITGVKINDGGADSQAFVRGTIYRQQQELMHNTIKPLLLSIAATLGVAGASLTAVAPFHLIPVVGPLLGSPGMGIAGGALTAAGPMFTAVNTAIAQFEALSIKYLSTHHEFAEAK